MLKPTIGIEVHCELKTNSKAFSPSENTYGEVPNKRANELDLGMPGTLPVLNKGMLDLGIKCALVLHCEVSKEMFFDRKNYFYPDNPRNFQITQNNTPVGRNGYVEIEYDGIKKKIEIEEIHMEEDTCKSIHEKDSTLLNFNRAGIPLIEIVTKPCISNEKEAVLYLENLREMLLYSGVSDVKIEEGSMRCELNISLSDTEELGTKVEVKNIGSINAVKESALYEIERQTNLINNGELVNGETRRWDDKTKTTIFMRKKEVGNDYRYFPEPDIPRVYVSDEWIESIRKTIPMLPNELKEKYKNLGINEVTIKSLIQNRELNIALNELIDMNVNPVLSANILTSDILFYLNSHFITFNDCKVTIDNIKDIVNLLNENKISSKISKEIIAELLENGGVVKEIIEKKGLSQISDEKVLLEIINNVLDNNLNAVTDYKNGLDRSIKFLMGQIMKETKGQANPKLANDLLISELNKR